MATTVIHISLFQDLPIRGFMDLPLSHRFYHHSTPPGDKVSNIYFGWVIFYAS